ncbi:MAG: metallopeptidase family protein [Elusimicrobia bacterium]|nr:metallopeptidase family protein [Elusimicrobiota bacterium]
MKLSRARFERMAEAALADIPGEFRDLLVDLEISVKAVPGPESGRWRGSKTLLGLYHGLQRAEMLSPYSGTHPPARIILYQRNIESLCRDEAELSRQIRVTLRHELAHHFGFSDQDLKERWPEGA